MCVHNPSTNQSLSPDDEFDPLQVQSLAKGKAKEDQVEFQDEEVTATVTVVEEFDVDELIHGPKPQTPNSLLRANQGADVYIRSVVPDGNRE